MEELSGFIFIKDGVPMIGVNSLHHPIASVYNRTRDSSSPGVIHAMAGGPRCDFEGYQGAIRATLGSILSAN